MKKSENNCFVLMILIFAFFAVVIFGYKKLFNVKDVNENFESSEQLELINTKLEDLEDKFTNFTGGVNTIKEEHYNLDKIEPYVNEEFANYTT